VRVFVAGVSGFIGRRVITTLGATDHVAVPLGRAGQEEGEWNRIDLRDVQDYRADLSSCDAVINLAGGRHDKDDEQPTAALLRAMEKSGVTRLIHVSSFSVYDYRSPSAGDTIDENSPIEPQPRFRDQYTRCKLQEEALVCAANIDLTILRLGAVYGPDRHWDGGMAATGFGLGLVIGPSSRQKLVSVQSAANAIVASLAPEAIGHKLNIIDSALPDQRSYEHALRQVGVDLPRSIPVSFRAANAVAMAADLLTRPTPSVRARLPEVLSLSRLAARHKPLEYSNRRASAVLEWEPLSGCDVSSIATARTL
jgi:2-alkyl-3-oxoalkanoate reductase